MTTEKRYKIQDREAGNLIEDNLTFEQATKQLAEFEEQDKKENIFVSDFYQIVEDDTPIKESIEVKEDEGYTKGEWSVYSKDWIYSGNICIATIQECGDTNQKKCNAELIASAPKLKKENTLLKKQVDDNVAERNNLKDKLKNQLGNNFELQRQNEILLTALKNLYNAVDSCIDLTPEVLRQADVAIKQNTK